jgi:Cu(I)/Ag(I) efflux system membrane fusion protein
MLTADRNDKQPESTARAAWWRSALRQPVFWVIIVAALALGFLLRGGSGRAPSSEMAAQSGGGEVTMWTCSMHPQIRLPEPGQCPICFMDLIPVKDNSGEEDSPRLLTMSNTAKKLAQIVTAPVERRFADARIQLVGKIAYDETRLARIAAWVPGRLDSLYADFTGVTVQEGDPLALIYSPELLAAQEELLQAIATARKVGQSELTTIRQTAQATIASARDKLRLLGLTAEQIAAIESRGTPTDHVTIYAPIGGIVVNKAALEGEYVKTGTTIYTIADLSHVWLELDAYESDLHWLSLGQEIEFTTEAVPGETFAGTITFIEPFLSDGTRTVDVRVDVPNPNLRLKPGMFATATVKSHSGSKGAVAAGSEEAPLIIPASAPLITGKRAVVYVALPDRERPTYEGRDVVLGPRAGDYYIVESGLQEGEMVVVNGAFKIDSELQIRAEPSMMSPEGGAVTGQDHGDSGEKMADMKPKKTPPPPVRERLINVPDAFRAELQSIYEPYFALHAALADDQYDDAIHASHQLQGQVSDVTEEALPDTAQVIWHELVDRLTQSAEAAGAADNLEALRVEFESLAAVMIDIDYYFGHLETMDYYVTLCPMAFNGRGAYWLQDQHTIENPFYGHKMLRCGSVTDTIPAAQVN